MSDIVKSIEKGVHDVLDGIGKFFTDLLSGVLDGIKRFFIPDPDIIQGFIDEISSCFKSTFGFDGFDVSSVVGTATAFDNINGNIKYGQFDFNGMIIDFSFALKALITFKPYIRAFVAFCIVIYNINQFLGIIGVPTLTSCTFGQFLHDKNVVEEAVK